MKDWFVHLAPFMLALYALLRIARAFGLFGAGGRAAFFLVLLLTALMGIVPVNGLFLTEYILSVNPVFSMGSAAMLLFLISRLMGRALLPERDFLSFCGWNVAVSVCLYASCWGLIGPDIYWLGYGFSALFVLTLAITALLALRGSPLVYVFVSYIAAFDLGLLPSENFFDYITDGPLFLASLAVPARRGAKALAGVIRGRPGRGSPRIVETEPPVIKYMDE